MARSACAAFGGCCSARTSWFSCVLLCVLLGLVSLPCVGRPCAQLLCCMRSSQFRPPPPPQTDHGHLIPTLPPARSFGVAWLQLALAQASIWFPLSDPQPPGAGTDPTLILPSALRSGSQNNYSQPKTNRTQTILLGASEQPPAHIPEPMRCARQDGRAALPQLSMVERLQGGWGLAYCQQSGPSLCKPAEHLSSLLHSRRTQGASSAPCCNGRLQLCACATFRYSVAGLAVAWSPLPGRSPFPAVSLSSEHCTTGKPESAIQF